MIWAVYQQNLDPLSNRYLSTFFAALPVVVLFYLLVPRRWLASKAAAVAALSAFLIAWLAFGMPPGMAALAFVHGAAFGLLPVGWTIFNAMLLYNITVRTGQFDIVRRSIAGLSADARIQAILIAFAFGAFLEGAAGGGTPVAICGAIMVGLGFDPFLAAVLCLIANTSPVAYGGLGTPLIVLGGVTGLPTETLSVMAGRQLPFLSFLVPMYMVKCMCSWKQSFEVWPALLVSGGSFSIFQYTLASSQFYPMTDIGGGIFSLVLTAILLKFWKPRTLFQFDKTSVKSASATPVEKALGTPWQLRHRPIIPQPRRNEQPLTWRSVSLAWAPFAIMSVLLMLTGLVRQKEGPTKPPVRIGPLQTNYYIPIPALNGLSYRDPQLHAVKTISHDLQPVTAAEAAALIVGSNDPLTAVANAQLARTMVNRPEEAEFNFAWLTSPGSAVFLAALLSMLLLRMRPAAIGWVFRRTFFQMKIPIPTIACMLGLSYITRYAGMDATLGVAFAGTGIFYPFFAPILGWLGVFLTGTDAGSNALFGSLQRITASQVYKTGAFTHLSEAQAQVLICTANSTGGVMGKMIDAQSICVATAATNQLGKEADIFKAVIWHSIILAALVGLMTLLQAYVVPFTQMVPKP